MAIDPEIWSYQAAVTHDGTRTGIIAAAVEYMRTHDPEAVNCWFVFNGEVITIDAALARGECQQ